MKINSENISHIYNVVISFASLNFIFIDNLSNKIRRINCVELPSKIQEQGIEICKIIKENLTKGKKDDVYYIADEFGLKYMGFNVFDDEEIIGNIILGPYSNYIFENNLYESVPVLNDSQESAICHIVTSMLNSKINKGNKIEIKYNKKNVNEENYNIEDYEKNRIEIKERYKMEEELLHHVSNGNEKAALVFCNKKKFSGLDRFPDMPLRNKKNLMITMNTLFRKCIEKNNIDEYYLHTTSEKFARKIEYAKSINDLDGIFNKMIKDYCELVKNYTCNNYTNLVSQAVNYIRINYNQEISLESIAKELFVHKTYLAKKFKEETNETTSQYINKVRIEEAKFMLNNTDLNIETIGYYVGYNDQKYFSKTFKKITGKSPKEYRKNNQ